MIDKTYIKSKDTPLEDTINKLESILKSKGFDIIIKSKLNPISNIWSLHIYEKTCPMLYSNGKGASYKAALASALAEFMERLLTKFFFSDFYFGKKISNNNFVFFKNEKWFSSIKEMIDKKVFTKKLYSIYNIDKELKDEMLVDFNTGNYKRGICTLLFYRVRDNKKIYFPINILNNLYVSNGMSAGNNKYEAYVQALCEILERFVKNKIIKECISLPIIPEKELSKIYPLIKNIKNDFLKKGYVVNIYDGSLGGQFPVISAVLFDKKNNNVLVSFGAHLNISVAIERALTELMQGRDFSNFSDLKTPIFDNEMVKSEENLIDHFINSTGYISWDFFSEKNDYDFVFWNNDLSNEKGFNYICNLIHSLNKDIYIADYEESGFYVSRIIVPCFSEVYPLTDIIFNNTSSKIFIRDLFFNLKKLSKSECKYFLNKIEDEGLDDYDKLFNIIGILPDKDSIWEYISIADIKLSLYLFLGKFKEAYETINFLLNNDKHEYINLYKCIKTLLEIKFYKKKNISDYETGFANVYDRETLEKAKFILKQKEKLVWGNLTDINKLKNHKTLLILSNLICKNNCF